MRRAAALLTAAALALGASACGEDEEPKIAEPEAAAVQLSPQEVLLAAKERPYEEAAARPNLLGGKGEIGRLLDYLHEDLTLFYGETLEPKGVQVTAPKVQSEAGATCDGQPTSPDDEPRWCAAEKAILAPAPGAEAVRTRDGSVGLYLLVAWAHAQAVGDQLGWPAAVAQGKLTPAAVGRGEFCLFSSWVIYTAFQAVIEDSDFPTIERYISTNKAFDSVLPHIRQQEFARADRFPTVCV